MDKFELANYIPEIRMMATANKVDDAHALDMFVTNLNTINPYYKGAEDTLNFRILGQQWGRLPSAEKVEQMQKMRETLKAPAAPKYTRKGEGK